MITKTFSVEAPNWRAPNNPHIERPIIGRTKGEKRMSKSAHTEAQIIGAVKQVESGRKVEEVAREVGVSKHTIYAWKQKYGGLEVAEAQELRHLREENAKLKKLVAEYALDKEALKSVIAKNGYSS